MNAPASLRVASFNCHGVRSSLIELRALLDRVDILLLQEHWLSKQQLHELKSIHMDFDSYGASPMDFSEGVLRGRPFGGVGILFRKCLASVFEIVEEEERLLIVRVNTSYGALLLGTVYMPVDQVSNVDLFLFYLGKIQSHLEGEDLNYALIVGDFNADPGKGLFFPLLRDFAEANLLRLADIESLPHDSLTHLNHGHNSTSWLDHILCSDNLFPALSQCGILLDFISSDHFPMLFLVSMDLLPTVVTEEANPEDPDDLQRRLPSQAVDWDACTPEQIGLYQEEAQRLVAPLMDTVLPLLSEVNKVGEGVDDRKVLLEQILAVLSNCLLDAASRFLPARAAPKSHKGKAIPGWTEAVGVHHANARRAFLAWVELGRPREGPAALEMRRTRMRFRQALKECRRREKQIVADKLALKLANKDHRSFWRSASSSGALRSRPVMIDDAVGDKKILEMWRSHYSSLFNSVSDSQLPTPGGSPRGGPLRLPITDAEVHTAILQLSSSGPGPDGLSASHLKFSPPVVWLVLASLFNSCFELAFLPDVLMRVAIQPIVKNKHKPLSSKENYRPIALAGCLSKVLERIILHRVRPVIGSSDNQFGFKEKLSTDCAIFVLKDIVNQSVLNDTPVFAMFLGQF